ATINPMPGVVDLLISNGEGTISADLAKTLARVPGVQQASPRIFEKIKLPDHDQRGVLVMGVELMDVQKNPQVNVDFSIDHDVDKIRKEITAFVGRTLPKLQDRETRKALDEFLAIFLDQDSKKIIDEFLSRLISSPSSDQIIVDLLKQFTTLVGEELNKELMEAPKGTNYFALVQKFLPEKLKAIAEDFRPFAEEYFSHILAVQKDPKSPKITLLRVGTVKAKGVAAFLGGYTLTMDLDAAGRILGMEKGQVNRIDLTLKKGVNKSKVRAEVEKLARGHGAVRTPEEQNRALGSVMEGMQTGFALCGVAALVVGLFLVYNALAVCVAERRH